MFVLDASVVIKWFSQEKYTEKALKIREMFLKGECEIVVPDLLLYEISNALRYNPNFKENDVKEAIDSLFSMELNIVVPISEIVKTAATLAFKHNITAYDAVYLALAKEIKFTCVTADKKLYDKVKSLKFVKFITDV